jgi:plasmid stabilization system protein ParE
MPPAGELPLTKPTRSQEREINDLENWIATVNEYLTVLEEHAKNARSEAQARSTDRKIKAQLRRLASLKARRAALQQLLSPKRK